MNTIRSGLYLVNFIFYYLLTMLDISFTDVALYFKTKKCVNFHSPEENDICFYYHDDSDMRRAPLTPDGKSLAYHNILFIPTLVSEDQRASFCQNLPEYSYHILNYKTKPCPYLTVNKTCGRQKFCPYIHPGDDLGPLAKYRERFIVPPPLPLLKTRPEQALPEKVLPALVPKEDKKRPPYLYPISDQEDAYIFHAQVDFQEDDEHEFKAWTFAKNFDWLMDTLQEYICAFVNTNGGTIYIGITDDGNVTGAVCDRGVIDKIRLTIDKIVLLLKDQCKIENGLQANAESAVADSSRFQENSPCCNAQSDYRLTHVYQQLANYSSIGT
eukprot:TRINITY_DN1467_c0_g1_i1.p5 TRINITY_DN1467_c0_g1~~TRINITY_DN1467_c0_g1_i1.p5  ORF type:complete len:327 (-),score=26.49 TRINITY_DN1467_c0_g1_i1:2482-3462(-)